MAIQGLILSDAQLRFFRIGRFILIWVFALCLGAFLTPSKSVGQSTGEQGGGQGPGEAGYAEGAAAGGGHGEAQATQQGEAAQGQTTGSGGKGAANAQTAAQAGRGQTPPGIGSAAVGTTNDAAQAPEQNANTEAGCPATIRPALNLANNGAEAPAIGQGGPYCDIPSLQDLNTQVPIGIGEAPKRFGSDAFYVGTGNVNELPMDLPVGPDYVLGPGDSIVVNMWGGQSARIDVVIDRQGEITLPDAGAISINGLTIAGAQSAIEAALKEQFKNEHVEISLGRVRTVRVYVVGDVQRPGAYDLSALSTPLNALYAAGGPTARGSLRTLRQFRGGTLVKEFDLYDFLLKGIRTDPGHLLPGDTILVPPVGPQVTVRGFVHRSAIYELREETTLAQVLDLAGGPLITASLRQIHVERVEAHERRTMLNLQMPDDHDQIVRELSAFQVQGGDDVLISPILPYNEQEVYLEGHVNRPGRYPYHDGMTINDLIHSYQDVLPQPADHAEVIRLQAPDYRPETINVELPDVLAGNDPMPLQPFDVVRIYGRYAIDPPMVTIKGEVLRPGEYPMSKGMTSADLVRMAGGFKRSAYTKEADLATYVVQNGQKVLVKSRMVSIEDALRGDKNADVVLEPGDVLGIRQLSGWQDIGASITVNGEVQFAGTYAIEEGERLSSILKKAGGFREDAFPEGAVLQRVSVRDLEDKNREELIQRIEIETPILKVNPGETQQNQQDILQAMRQEQQEAIASLRSHPGEGRLVVRISEDIAKWTNTPADIVVRAGDTVTIPKRPDVVVISGQVYNPAGISYEPGKDAKWYLERAGGVTDFGDRKHIFIVRANGEVVAQSDAYGLFSGGELSVHVRPGDSIIVPEKVIGGSLIWRNLIATAQIMSSVALTGAAVGAF